MNNEEFELLGEPRMTMAQFELEERLYGLEENDEALEVDMNEHTKGPWEVTPNYPLTIRAGMANVAQAKVRNGAHPNNPNRDAALANARLLAEAPEMYTELNMIVDAWEEIDVGKVPGRQLTPWEKERLNFARDLLDQIDGN